MCVIIFRFFSLKFVFAFLKDFFLCFKKCQGGQYGTEMEKKKTKMSRVGSPTHL